MVLQNWRWNLQINSMPSKEQVVNIRLCPYAEVFCIFLSHWDSLESIKIEQIPFFLLILLLLLLVLLLLRPLLLLPGVLIHMIPYFVSSVSLSAFVRKVE